jgi:excisionase family DNA binding protein
MRPSRLASRPDPNGARHTLARSDPHTIKDFTVIEPERPKTAATLLTIGQAADLVGYHRDAIHDAMRKGRLKYTHVEGRRMCALEDVRDLERRGVAR